MSSKISISRAFNPNTGNIDFAVSVGPSADKFDTAAFAATTVNLSRGGNRQYSLLGLSAHNGRGANWTDGDTSIHSKSAMAAYIERVDADIQDAVECAYDDASDARDEASVVVTFSTAPVTIV